MFFFVLFFFNSSLIKVIEYFYDWKLHVYIQDAKQEDISAHFQTFGEIDNINIKTDPATGRSR